MCDCVYVMCLTVCFDMSYSTVIAAHSKKEKKKKREVKVNRFAMHYATKFAQKPQTKL